MTMQHVNGSAAMAPPKQDDGTALVARVVANGGDLEGLKPIERAHFYARVCDSLGLNPLTMPFAFIKLNGKLRLYALRECSDQLRKINGVAITIVGRDRADDLIVVTARATTPDGRTDESTGAVSIAGLKGENLANAIMKAETKAKRRVTLSICGLGWLDETEIGDIKAAKRVEVTVDGEIVDRDSKPAEVSEPDIEDQLSRSIDWCAWADGYIGDFDRATQKGDVMQLWTLVNDDVKKLKPPPNLVEQVKESKDRAKARLS